MNYRSILSCLICILIFISCSDEKDAENPSISLNKSKLEIKIGEKETLQVLITPTSNDPVIWESSDNNVATVFLGTVTAVSSGSTTITATCGSLSSSCEVTVPDRSYKLVWYDEFEGTSLNTNYWNYEIGTGSGGWGNQEKQYYTNRSENIRVENGYLVIEAKKESYQKSDYTSARITSKGKAQFAYGKMEARISLPKGKGSWPAFWMLGAKGSWPRSGEIDIMEHVGSDPTMVSFALHTNYRNGSKGNNWSKVINWNNSIEESFHTYGIEWVEKETNGLDRIRFYVDGEPQVVCGEMPDDDENAWPFNAEFYFILNLAIGGKMGGDIDDAMFDQKVEMKVDWVKVYQLQYE